MILGSVVGDELSVDGLLDVSGSACLQVKFSLVASAVRRHRSTRTAFQHRLEASIRETRPWEGAATNQHNTRCYQQAQQTDEHGVVQRGGW